MKITKKALYLAVFLFAGGLSGYSYNQFSIDNPGDKFKEAEYEIEVSGNTLGHIFSDLEKENYLLRLKSHAHKKNRPQAVYFNNSQLEFKQTARHLKRGTVLAKIPAEIIREGVNRLRVPYSEDISSSVKVVIGNYRKNFSERKGFIIFKSSRFLRSPHMDKSNKRLLVSLLLGQVVVMLIVVFSYLFFLFFNFSSKRIIQIVALSFIPCTVLLILVNIAPILTPFMIIFDRFYFIQVTLIPTIILEIILIFIYIGPENNKLVLLKKVSGYSFDHAYELKRKIVHTNVSTRFILLFIVLLLLTPISLILHLRTPAEFFASLSYLALFIGVVMKLIELKRSQEKGDEK